MTAIVAIEAHDRRGTRQAWAAKDDDDKQDGDGYGCGSARHGFKLSLAHARRWPDAGSQFQRLSGFVLSGALFNAAQEILATDKHR